MTQLLLSGNVLAGDMRQLGPLLSQLHSLVSWECVHSFRRWDRRRRRHRPPPPPAAAVRRHRPPTACRYLCHRHRHRCHCSHRHCRCHRHSRRRRSPNRPTTVPSTHTPSAHMHHQEILHLHKNQRLTGDLHFLVGHRLPNLTQCILYDTKLASNDGLRMFKHCNKLRFLDVRGLRLVVGEHTARLPVASCCFLLLPVASCCS